MKTKDLKDWENNDFFQNEQYAITKIQNLSMNKRQPNY